MELISVSSSAAPALSGRVAAGLAGEVAGLAVGSRGAVALATTLPHARRLAPALVSPRQAERDGEESMPAPMSAPERGKFGRVTDQDGDPVPAIAFASAVALSRHSLVAKVGELRRRFEIAAPPSAAPVRPAPVSFRAACVRR